MMKIVKENYKYILSFFGLVILYYVIMKSPLFVYVENFDYVVRRFVDGIRTDGLTVFFNTITLLGDKYIPIVAIVCILIFVRNKRYAFTLGISYGISSLITIGLKYLYMRPRPLEAITKIPSSYSFPSGHTMTAIMFYFIFWYLLTLKSKNKFKNISLVFFITICSLIGLSRIYLGVHFFSDVVSGAILCVPMLLMIYNIIDKHLKKGLKKLK